MTKLQFILSLNEKLSGFPKEEVEERINFYSEMIEDRMEEGLSEEEAVAAVGSIDDIVSHISSEFPVSISSNEKVKTKKKVSARVIILLILGSPLWLTLLLTVFVLVLSLYITLWSIVVTLWAVFGALVGSSFGVIFAGTGLSLFGIRIVGVALLGLGIVCAGASILWFYLCKLSTKGILLLTKKLFWGFIGLFSKREAL